MRWEQAVAAPDFRQLWLAGANASFPAGWGDARLYDWAFLSARAGRTARLLFAFEGNEALAGSAVTFRRVRSSAGCTFLTAIMTGSWTRPDARGRGCFSAIIEQSRDVAREAGAETLLAFVTADNASRRALEKAGAALFGSAYCRGLLSSSLHTEPAPDDASVFEYDEVEWRVQLLERPTTHPVARIGDGVVESSPDFLRVHTTRGNDRLLEDVSRSAAETGRRLFCFTTREALRDALASQQFEIIPGFVAVLGLGSRSATPFIRSWNLENGDRL